MLLRRRRVITSQNYDHDWWKIEPRYSTKVLIGNWLEERERERSSPVEFRKDTEKLNHSIYRTDFVFFPDHKPDQTLRRAMVEKMEGLPRQHFFTHHEEPTSHNLVSEYDDKYNRHSYNLVLPPLCKWSGPKSSWIPQKSDFPITKPPTNYGLLEHLMKKWHKKEAGVNNSVYTISYEAPPIPTVATHHRRRPPETPGLPFIQGSPPQNVSGILDCERLRNTCKSSAGWLNFQLKDTDASYVWVEQQRHLLVKRFLTKLGEIPNSAAPVNHKATLVMKSFRDARALLIDKALSGITWASKPQGDQRQ